MRGPLSLTFGLYDVKKIHSCIVSMELWNQCTISGNNHCRGISSIWCQRRHLGLLSTLSYLRRHLTSRSYSQKEARYASRASSCATHTPASAAALPASGGEQRRCRTVVCRPAVSEAARPRCTSLSTRSLLASRRQALGRKAPLDSESPPAVIRGSATLLKADTGRAAESFAALVRHCAVLRMFVAHCAWALSPTPPAAIL